MDITQHVATIPKFGLSGVSFLINRFDFSVHGNQNHKIVQQLIDSFFAHYNGLHSSYTFENMT